jgi:hypothetical protein
LKQIFATQSDPKYQHLSDIVGVNRLMSGHAVIELVKVRSLGVVSEVELLTTLRKRSVNLSGLEHQVRSNCSNSANNITIDTTLIFRLFDIRFSRKRLLKAGINTAK